MYPFLQCPPLHWHVWIGILAARCAASWPLLVVGALASYLYRDFRWKRRYWLAKGIPAPPLFPQLGFFADMVRLGLSQFDARNLARYGRLFGYFDGPTPVLVTSDNEMLQQIFITDFSIFHNRREFDLHGPIMSMAVNFLRDHEWKEMRGILQPAFTAAKLRQMSGLLNECCSQTLDKMAHLADTQEEFDAKELFGRLTLDVVASSFFGARIDCQRDPDNLFLRHAKNLFNYISLRNPFLFIAFLFPNLIPLWKRLGLRFLQKEPVEFFINSTTKIIRMRVRNQQTRKDFVQLMLQHLDQKERWALQSKASAAEQPGPVPVDAEQLASVSADVLSDVLKMDGLAERAAGSSSRRSLTLDEIVAQSVIIFVSGYETTAIALSCMAYVLALHPAVQERLHAEIRRVLPAGGEASMEQLAQMGYLDACVNETLRLFPSVTRTERQCSEDWYYGGVKYDQGTVFAVPIYAINRDPDYFPDPEIFDPDRFSKDNKQRIQRCTFLSFGQGPRHCLGMRFAYFEIKYVMVRVLQQFRFVRSQRTKVPMQIRDFGFLTPKAGTWIKLERRQ
ncbi:cytochrome P450 3A24-like [Paramacrobiotus metropolitanus]|uniref:cytochrome P450 3A24-like n=1 Tax=Paramacrobiotus metropolitanus TaxID=2943436 RepID=UPI002446528F|nr:cytochrome P450 3A24-like [Paramacrobiotus metropolitanus]